MSCYAKMRKALLKLATVVLGSAFVLSPQGLIAYL